MVRKKKKREDEVVPWCYYCDRKFADESTLIQHQKAKHFKCAVCHKKLTSASGLRVHCSQVHRFQISSVPAAKPGRESMEVEVFGMAGIPAGALPGAVPADDEEPASKAARTDAPPLPPPVLPAPGPPVPVPPRLLAPATLAPPLPFVPPPFPMHPGMPPPYAYLPRPGMPPPLGMPGVSVAGAPPGMPPRPIMMMHGAPPPGWPIPGYPPPGAMHFVAPPQPGQPPLFPIAPASGGVPAAAPAPGGGSALPTLAPLFPIGSSPVLAVASPAAAGSGAASTGAAQNGGAHAWMPPGDGQPAATLQLPSSSGRPAEAEQPPLAGAAEEQGDDVSPEEARAKQPKYQAKLAAKHASLPG